MCRLGSRLRSLAAIALRYSTSIESISLRVRWRAGSLGWVCSRNFSAFFASAIRSEPSASPDWYSCVHIPRLVMLTCAVEMNARSVAEHVCAAARADDSHSPSPWLRAQGRAGSPHRPRLPHDKNDRPRRARAPPPWRDAVYVVEGAGHPARLARESTGGRPRREQPVTREGGELEREPAREHEPEHEQDDAPHAKIRLR